MKVIFLTNVIRRMGMMQQTMEKLQQEGKLDNACACPFILMLPAARRVSWRRD